MVLPRRTVLGNLWEFFRDHRSFSWDESYQISGSWEADFAMSATHAAGTLDDENDVVEGGGWE